MGLGIPHVDPTLQDTLIRIPHFISINCTIIFLHSEGRDKDDLHVQVDGVGLVVVSVDMRSFLESVYA